LHSSSSSVQILRITCDPERVKVGFKDFGTEDVKAVGYVEAVFVVKLELCAAWSATAGEVTVVGDESEGFGADAGPLNV
jgi:hypothetical protein